MPKLNQILAIEKAIKTEAEATITEAYHKSQKPALFAGYQKTYQPRDEEGEPLPPEFTRVQEKVNDLLDSVAADMTRLFDVTAQKDFANCVATADVKVDGKEILKGVPATYLLFLEKQLVALHTFVKKLPTLDGTERWAKDATDGFYKSEPVETVRTKKVLRNHVKVEATDKHPAQVETYTEDVPVGRWRNVKWSGAVPAADVEKLLERVEKLQEAVKFAREEANGTAAAEQKVGKPIFDYLFG